MNATPAPARGQDSPHRTAIATLARRAGTMAWGLPVVAACLYLGGWGLCVCAMVLAGFCLVEFWPLGRAIGAAGPPRPEVFGAVALVLAGATAGPRWLPAALAAGLVAVLCLAVVRAAAAGGPAAQRPQLATTIWAIVALVYIAWLLGHLLLLRGSGPLGLDRALAAVAMVWGADVAGFLGGSLLGRHRLAAAISPGKTVEGVGAAAVGAAAVGVAMAGLIGLSAADGIVVGVLLAFVGLVGDLWESLCKRGVGFKDSGAGLPGHGGVLDRFDSLLVAAPVAYWLLAVVPWAQLPLGPH